MKRSCEICISEVFLHRLYEKMKKGRKMRPFCFLNPHVISNSV